MSAKSVPGFACGRRPVRGGIGGRAPDQACRRRRAPDALDPHQAAIADEPPSVGDTDDVGIHPGHRVVGVVHVRLVYPHQHLLSDLERQRTFLDLGPGALVHHLEGAERERVAALEVEVPAGLLLQLVQRAVLAQ